MKDIPKTSVKLPGEVDFSKKAAPTKEEPKGGDTKKDDNFQKGGKLRDEVIDREKAAATKAPPATAAQVKSAADAGKKAETKVKAPTKAKPITASEAKAAAQTEKKAAATEAKSVSKAKAAATAPAKSASVAPATTPKPVPKVCPFIQSTAGSTKRRLKVFIWGPTGSGKTTIAIDFPDPAIIDIDGGAKLYAEAKGLYRTGISDFDEAVVSVDWLLQNKHGFKTLIVDPITKLWEMLQWKWNAIFLKRNKGGAGHKFDYYKMQMGDWAPMKAEWKQFIQKILALDMNIVVTAREKDLFADDGSMKKIGLTFDGEKNLPYEFDLNLRLSVNPDDGKHYATIAGDKDRTRNLPWVKDNPLPLGKPFLISYEVLRKHLGKDWLEREAEDVNYFVSEADQAKITKAFKSFGLTQRQAKIWLARHDADEIKELTHDAAQKVFAEIKLGKAKQAAKAEEAKTKK